MIKSQADMDKLCVFLEDVLKNHNVFKEQRNQIMDEIIQNLPRL